MYNVAAETLMQNLQHNAFMPFFADSEELKLS